MGKAPVTYILLGKLPVPRNTSVSKIGNGVVSLLGLLQCHCNPDDHNKFPSLSNTILVVIFLNLCQLRHNCSTIAYHVWTKYLSSYSWHATHCWF